MPRSAFSLDLNEPDRQQLLQWSSAFGTPQQVALRCRIVLTAAEGRSAEEIAARLDVDRKTAMLWRARFQRQGLDGLWEVAPGRGRKPTYGPEKIQSIVDATLRSKPKGMTHWSCRLMAEAQDVSKSTVNNIWQSHNLKPHRVKLRRSPEVAQLHSVKMTRSGNRIGNGKRRPAIIIHAEGVWEWCWGGQPYPRRRRAGEFSSSAPKARILLVVVTGFAVKDSADLPGLGEAFHPVAQVSEIVRADAQAEHFVDHRKKVG